MVPRLAALATSRRALCPCCGVPLPLARGTAVVTCDFCGGEASLHRRLRALEPRVGTLAREAGWHPLVGRYAAAGCGGCGAAVEVSSEAAIVACPHCGSDNRVESRLLPIAPPDLAPPQRRTRADLDNQRRGRVEHRWEIATEQLLWRVTSEPDAARRLALAQELASWAHANRTAAHFLPFVIARLGGRLDAVGLILGDLVGKLLCEGDLSLILPVIQAAAAVVGHPDCPRHLLSELALGPGPCVKLLLDAAEAAAARGDRDLACHALWGVNTLFGRNFPDHQRMAEVVLYRLFWLDGAVLGWGLSMLRNGFHNGVRLPWRTLVVAVDDFAAERPLVVPALLANLYPSPAESVAEHRDRLHAIRAARSSAAKALVAETLFTPPGGDEELLEETVAALESLVGDAVAEAAVARALCRLIEDGVPAAVLALVARHGEALPRAFKRALIRQLPDTSLLDTSVPYYWESEPGNEPGAAEAAFTAAWKDGITAVVDSYRAEVARLRQEIAAAAAVAVEVFDDDDQPTIQPTVIATVEADVVDRSALPAGLEQLQAAYQREVAGRVAELSAPGTSDARRGELMAEIAALGERLGAAIQAAVDDAGG